MASNLFSIMNEGKQQAKTNRPSFAELLRESRQQHVITQTSLNPSIVEDAASICWELYRNKVITSYQAKMFLLAWGFTTVSDQSDNLVTFR